MRKTMIIPTYWCRKTGDPWQEGDAVYDHPTPVDQEGTLERTLVSMKQFSEKDFKLVILICPTTPEVEAAAYEQVLRIVVRAQLNAETYLFTAGDLREITEILRKAGLNDRGVQLLSMFGYSNVRNICLLAASTLTADAALLIDDDEVFELPDFVPRSLEFLGRRVYGDIVHGVAGYYLNSKGQYYDDVSPEPWMTYWDRFGCKARAFDQIIGSGPRLKRTPFAFGGAMILHRELFECVPFDPLVTRGEDVDYLINSRIFGFSFFLDNTLSIKHLPQPKSHPQWKRLREDIYRFVYQRAKMQSQHKTGNLVHVSPEDFDPYPGEFLKPDLDEKIYRSSMMLSSQYLANNDPDAAMEAMRNIYVAKHNAPPSFDAFRAYLDTQTQWERLIHLVRQERYAVRAVLDESPNLAPGYEAVRRAADTAGAEQRVEDTAALEALLGPGLHISPTRFEKYQYCPFGYFLQYILKAAPRQKAELAPNISGTLTHWVLENALRRQGEAFKDLTPEELETLVNDLVDEYTAANLPGMTLRMEYLVGRIRRNLVGLLGFIQRDLRQSGFQPVAFELRIDDRPNADDPDAPRVDPVELDDGAGHTVRIVGTVDRVDAMPLEKLGRTYLRVVDYKTGGKEFKLKEVYCGLDCQMLLYLFTLERNARRQFPGATAAGVEYLLADPAPKSVDRSELGDDADPAPTYPMNGLLLDEESIYRAMDTKGTGEFVPLSFSAKTGKPLNAKSTLADTAKLGRIRDHLDGLLIDMAKNLYSGRIDAEPLCTGGRSPCTYCEFRCACTHRDGEHERTINIKDDPFAE